MSALRNRLTRVRAIGSVGPVPAVALTMAALAILLSAFALEQPYHVDTTAYFGGLRDLQAGDLSCRYATRCMVSYYLIPFAIFGGAAVKVGFIAAAVLFFLFSYQFLSRALDAPTAYASSLLVLMIPAGLVTVTHLKEDFVGLMFVAAALSLATCRPAPAQLASGLAFAFGLLAKETFLLLTPFYLSVLCYFTFALQRTSRDVPRSTRRGLLALGAVAVAAGTTALLNRDYLQDIRALTQSPYLGQFKGPFSALLPAGFDLYRQGIGNTALFWSQLAGIAGLVAETDRQKRLLLWIFALNAVLLAVFSMNNTVMTYRNFVLVAFVTFPLATYGIERLIGRRWLYVATAFAVALLAVHTYPYLAFHSRHNSQEQFFADLKSEIRQGAVLLTMDYAGLAQHYLGGQITTHQRIADPDEAAASQFVASIRADRTRDYYLLPDALSYDARNTVHAKLLESFVFEPVYEGWFEDYHSMHYGYRPGELLTRLARQARCRGISYQREGIEPVGVMALDVYEYQLDCTGVTRVETSLGYAGRAFPSLRKVRVYRLVHREM